MSRSVSRPTFCIARKGASRHGVSRLRPLACSIALVFASGGVNAQSTNSAPEIEEITIFSSTGTGIRGVAPVGAQVVALDRESLIQEPVRDPSSLIADLPQGSSFGFREDTGSYGSSGINLRGLGPNATLVLVDGKRLQPGGVQNIFVDPNQIPFAAIERVEVVLGGSSAIYGSDAVAGVVNYILRDKYDGFSMTVRGTSNELQNGQSAEFLWGRDFGNASAMIGFSYEDRGGFLRGERDYMRSDLRSLGGNDNRSVGNNYGVGTPGNIRTADGTFYGIPANFAGTIDPQTGFNIPRADEILASRGQMNLVDTADYTHFVPDRKRKTWYAKLRWDISDTVEISYTGLVSKRHSVSDSFQILNINVPPESPLYIRGLDPLGRAYRVDYSSTAEGLPRTRLAYDETSNHYIDLRADIMGDWQINSSLMWGETENCGNCGNERNQIKPGLYSTIEPGLLNPYITGSQPGLAQLHGMTHHMGWGEQTALDVRFEGPVMDLPAGKIRASFGGSYTEQSFRLKLDQDVRDYAGTMIVARDAPASREIDSLFGEVFIPVFEMLDLNLALRRDNYSDFGSTTNPKVGINFYPTGDLVISGTWGKAFRAATLTENNPGVSYGAGASEFTNNTGNPNFPITYPGRGTTVLMTRSGNSDDLKPEKAEVYSIGATYTPEAVPGLNLNVTYYNVDYSDRLENVPGSASALASPENLSLYSPFITVAPQPSTCVPGDISTYNPIYIPWLTNPNRLASTNFGTECEAVALFHTGRQNTGRVVQAGVDVSASYLWMTNAGEWDVSGVVTNILSYKQSFLPDQELQSVIDLIGFQVSERARFKLGWKRDSWSASLSANYIGGYTNNNPITVNGQSLGESKVPSWTVLDASISYTVPEIDGSLLSDTRVTLGIGNIADKQVPIVLSGQNAFDANIHDPLGRQLLLEVTKSF